jgi:hypothetical protein
MLKKGKIQRLATALGGCPSRSNHPVFQDYFKKVHFFHFVEGLLGFLGFSSDWLFSVVPLSLVIIFINSLKIFYYLNIV